LDISGYGVLHRQQTPLQIAASARFEQAPRCEIKRRTCFELRELAAAVKREAGPEGPRSTHIRADAVPVSALLGRVPTAAGTDLPRISRLSGGFIVPWDWRYPGKPVFGFFVSNIEKSKRACG